MHENVVARVVSSTGTGATGEFRRIGIPVHPANTYGYVRTETVFGIAEAVDIGLAFLRRYDLTDSTLVAFGLDAKECSPVVVFLMLRVVCSGSTPRALTVIGL